MMKPVKPVSHCNLTQAEKYCSRLKALQSSTSLSDQGSKRAYPGGHCFRPSGRTDIKIIGGFHSRSVLFKQLGYWGERHNQKSLKPKQTKKPHK